MLRIIFIIFVLLHGFIHLLGFIKAFELAKVSQLSMPISKPIGILWLLVTLLFVFSIAFFFLKNDFWWAFIFIAIFISQLLIFYHWQDAKFGTIANVIILFVSLSAFGGWKFDKMVNSELNSFLPKASSPSLTITENSISHLPSIVQQWLRKSNVLGKPPIKTVHIFQSGRMKLKPGSAWMKVGAEQWFTIDLPGFIWNADVGEGSIIQFCGRDKLMQGKGHMLIKLFSLVSIVDAEGSNIDQGVLVRYLSEIIWFPCAALSKYIEWEEIGLLKTKATLRYNNTRVEGIFTFTEDGRPSSFEAKRFYDGTGELETWHIEIDENHLVSFNEKLIPTKADVTWKLKDGDFTWYEVEVIDILEN